MKKLLLLIISLLLAFNSYCQVGKADFINQLKQKMIYLEASKAKSINKFMKIGFKKIPLLKNKEIVSIPIYSIYASSKFINKTKNKDSLLLYLDCNKISISNIMFYKDNQFIYNAYPAYSNYNEQPIAVCNESDARFGKLILQIKPEILFYPAQYSIVIFLKENELYCLTELPNGNNNKKYSILTLNDYIKNHIKEGDIYFITSLTSPSYPIYSK